MSNERCMIVGFNIGRPLDHSLFAPNLMPFYGPCHSRKSINRALISHKRGIQARERRREEKGKEKEGAPPQQPSDHRQHLAGPPPDHRRNLAGPPQEPRWTTAEPRRTTTLRPDVQSLRSTEDPTSCRRPDVLFKA
ncbi:hypothetical protein KFK09_029274 [Dendrobium nobile]|uniref:Uncharacterized protein n=1 Tax=Dendrobium nobile TaxID=94219 RepID=A0A8T3A5A3_DENNO|nr:hypothetical protein KFK09_029274 [Dendrobium nobile]